MTVVFVIGSVLNIGIQTWLGDAIRWLIQTGVYKIEQERLEAEEQVAGVRRESAPEDEHAATTPAAESGAGKLFGATIGWIERELYIYALAFGAVGILSAVLLFKGFTGWITIGATDASKRPEALSHFYGYTIGNFISLGLAIAYYEIGLGVYHAASSLSGWPALLR
jgi:hypothetical protein